MIRSLVVHENKEQEGKFITLKIYSSQILKGIAITMVVIGHLSKEFDFMLYNLKFGGGWGVCLFLILSGFGITQSYKKNGTNLRKLKSRFIKILFPYAILTVVWIIIDKIMLKKSYSITTSILAIVGINLKPCIDGTMWFVTFILIWYTIFYFAFGWCNNKKISVIILFAFSIIIHKFNWIQPLSAPYIFDFPVGVCLGFILDKIKHKVKDKHIIVFNSICIIMFICTYSKMAQGQIYYLLADFAFAFGVIGIVILTELKSINVKLKLLYLIGDISYEIYLLEGALLFKYNRIHLFDNIFASLSIYFITLIILSILLKKFILLINSKASIWFA